MPNWRSVFQGKLINIKEIDFTNDRNSNIHDDQPPSPAPEKPTFEVDEELTEKLSNEAVENDEIFQRLRRTLQGMIENAESALVQKVNMSARVLAEYAQQEENEGMCPES